MTVTVYQSPAVTTIPVVYQKGVSVSSADADGRVLLVADENKLVLAVWSAGSWLRADIT